ncbi:hypothetical protein GCM10027589_34060 [Actinocorallia lasiicapitis]
MSRRGPVPRRSVQTATAAAIALLLLLATFITLRGSASADAAGAAPGQLQTTRVQLVNGLLIQANATETVTVTGVGGLPAEHLESVLLNVQAKGNWFNNGELRIYPSDAAEHAATSAAYNPNNYSSTSLVTRIGTDGKIKVTNRGGNVVRINLDVHGFTRDDAAVVGGTFVPLNPSRVLSNQSIAPGGNFELHPLGQGGVPATDVQAVAVTLTTKSPADSGTLRMYAGGDGYPSDADIDYLPNTFSTVHTVVKVGTGGVVNIHNLSFGATAVWVDVHGYYAVNPAAANRGVLRPVSQSRIYTNVSIPANGSYQFAPLGKGGLPTSAATSAVMLGLTASSTVGGILRVVPNGVVPGVNQTVSYLANKPTTSSVTVRPGTDGKVTIANASTGAVTVSIDAMAYYGVAPSAPVLSASPLASDGDAMSVLASTTPTITAKSTDPDGGDLAYTFEIALEGTTTAIATGTATAAAGQNASWTVPADVLRSPGTYLFRAKATDASGASAYGFWVRFAVDATVTPAELDVSVADPTSLVLSGVVSRASDRDIEARFYMFDNAGSAVGASPLGVTTAAGGTRAGLRVDPALLTAGQTYKWQLEACAEGVCAPRSELQTFVAPGQGPQTQTQTLVIGAAQIPAASAVVGATACAAAPCVLTAGANVALGGVDDAESVSRLKFDLSAIPAGAKVKSAVLSLGTPSCGQSCGADRKVGLYDLIHDFPASPTGLDVLQGLSTEPITSGPAAPSSIDMTSLVSSSSALAALGLAVRATPGTAFGYPASGVTLTVTYDPAGLPAQLSAVEARPGDGGLLATWSPPTDLGADTVGTGFDVEVLNGSGSVVAQNTTEDLSMIFPGLTNDGQYSVRVRAKTEFGVGPWVQSAVVTPKVVPGGAQQFVTAVEQFTTARQGVVDGTFPDLAAALAASPLGSLFKDALNVAADGLLAEKQDLSDSGVTRVDSSFSLGGSLVTYDQNAGTVTVRIELTTTTTDEVVLLDPDEQQTGPATETQTVDYVFKVGAAAAPSGAFGPTVQSATSVTPVLAVFQDGDDVDALDDATSFAGEQQDVDQGAGLLTE